MKRNSAGTAASQTLLIALVQSAKTQTKHVREAKPGLKRHASVNDNSARLRLASKGMFGQKTSANASSVLSQTAGKTKRAILLLSVLKATNGRNKSAPASRSTNVHISQSVWLAIFGPTTNATAY